VNGDHFWLTRADLTAPADRHERQNRASIERRVISGIVHVVADP